MGYPCTTLLAEHLGISPIRVSGPRRGTKGFVKYTGLHLVCGQVGMQELLGTAMTWLGYHIGKNAINQYIFIADIIPEHCWGVVSLYQVLYVDDEQDFPTIGKSVLEQPGMLSITPVFSVHEAVERLKESTFDAIISGHRMPGMDGVRFLQWVRSTGSDIPFIIVTCHGDENIVIESLNSGADLYFPSDQSPAPLFTRIADQVCQAIEKKQAENDALQANETLQKQARIFFILNEIITAANQAVDLPELVSGILEKTLLLLDFDAGGMYLANYEAGTAEVIHSKNLPLEFLTEVKIIPMDQPPYDRLFVKKEAIFTDHFDEVSLGMSTKSGFASLASIPMISGDTVVGVLNVVSRRRYVFSEQEKVILVSIGMETGATIGRMSAELGVVRASKNLETLFNSIDEMIFVLDMDGTIIWVNETVLRRLLYTRGELTGRDVISLHVPERQDEALCVLNEMINGKRDSCPVALGAKDGSRIEVETKVTRGSWNDQHVLIGVSRDITERIAFERAHERNEELLRLILSVSTGFINVSAEGIDAEITACLCSTGSFAGADRSYVFHISDDGTTMDNTHEWCADDIRPQMEALQAIPVDIFPWWMEKLGRGETIHVPRVQDLPDEASSEKETLQSQQIRSVLVVPLIFEKKLTGFLGFDSVREERPWPENVIALLGVTGKIISNAIARKRTEVALTRSREQFLLAIEGSDAGLWDWRVQTGEAIFNERWAAMIGYTLAELAPVSIDTWVKATHPDDLVRSNELLGEHFAGKTPEYECEVRVRHRDGHWVWVHDRGKVVEWDKDGNPARMTGTHLDITGRKQSEEVLAYRTALLANLLDSMPDIVFFKDRDGLYLGCNPSFAVFVGKPREEIVGKTDYDLFPKEVADEFRENDRAMMEGGAPRHNEEWIDYPDGRRALIDTFKAPLHTNAGAIIGLLGISRDITERKQAEEAVLQANKRLNILNEVTRHDVLNQLSSLIMGLETIKESISDSTLLELLTIALDASDRMTLQVQFTREYQNIGISPPQWQNVHDLIICTRELLPEDLFDLIDDTGNLVVYADPLLPKVFYNLLENSLRHGETVCRACFSCRESVGGLNLVYEDDGPGIDAESKKHLFKRGVGRHTGYGLFLVREILTITDITISETGEPGKGARFEIFLPQGTFRFDADDAALQG